jgi:pyruvate dehydrogenase E2 component (dihydrolipoamide acetyltransferase)
MITKVVLAKLSPTMEEGTIVKWSKNEGDAVKTGDVLAEIETDKANMEMEAQGTGILRKILVPAGGKAPVGALIGVVAAPEDDIASLLAGAAASPSPAPAPAATPPAEAAPKAPAPEPPKAAAPSPPPPKPAVAAPPPPPPTLVPSRPAPVAQAPEASGERVKASPLARSMAAQQQIPLSLVKGSGPGGRIVKKDIEGYQPTAGAATAPASAPLPGPTPGSDIPLSSMRKTIARRLTESVHTAPHFYVTVEIAMDAAIALKDQLLKGEEVRISVNDLVVKAAARALARFPAVNASWAEDAIHVHADIHVGIAVSIPDGLITPVVRNADRKSVLEISKEVRELATRARDRKLKPEEYMGSTFTISNLGMFDVHEFTAIINPPEAAILAVGSVATQAVVEGETIRPGKRMRVTLSSDHRLVDGVLAAQFLGELRRLLENPVSLFV